MEAAPTTHGITVSRKLPYFITSDECDVPRKLPFKKLQFSSSIDERDLLPSRPAFSSERSISSTSEVLDGDEDIHLPPTRPAVMASSDTDSRHLFTQQAWQTPPKPTFSTCGELPHLPSASKTHLEVPARLPFSFSNEYVNRSLSRSTSFPSVLHDYDDADDVGVMATLGAQYHSSGSSSMASNNGASRLAMMQARLREQLMVEKESRLLQMAARQEAEREGTIQRVTKSSASTLSCSLSSLSSLNSSGGQGRVRKMFEERRSNGYGSSPVGRDKSYPLEPMRGGSTGGGRPPVKPVKGVVRNRGVSVDRGKNNYDPDVMRRSRSHAALQQNASNNNTEPRSPARGLRPPQTRPPAHHKSTSSLLDANQNYNGRGPAGSRGPSRDPSPAPSPSHNNANRFGFRGTPSRGPSPAPSLNGSPARGPAAQAPRRANTFNHRQEESDRGRSPAPPSQPRQRPAQPPPRKPPARQPRQPPPRRQPPPPADDEADYDKPAFVSPRPPANRQSKQGGVPPITQVSAMNSPQPPTRSKPKPPPKPKAAPAASTRPSKPPPGLASCKICGRNFAPDRLEKHESICAKSTAKSKKRKKVFDPVKMRTKGTEAEKYVARGKHLEDLPKPKKKDWKKQHEDFIATIRAAKTGGQPPPTDNSDYIQCPHCGRKFAEAAADRHIPKCASIQSNKPAAGRRR